MKRLSAALGVVLFASLLTMIASSAASASCDYSDAHLNNGWGWDPASGTSCSPLQTTTTTQPPSTTTTQPAASNGCDYSAASQNGGWGWNPITRSSCPPTSTSQAETAVADSLVQPRLVRAIRHQTAVALDWDAGEVDSFVIVRNGVQIAQTTASAYTDSGLNTGATYKYRVYGVRGTMTAPGGGRPAPVLPPSWPTVELEPGTSGDVAGAPTTPAQEIQASLQAIEDGVIAWAVGLLNPLGNRQGGAPSAIGQLLAAFLGVNPVAAQEAEATVVMNAFLTSVGSNMRMPNPVPRAGSTRSHQYDLVTAARHEINEDIKDFADRFGRYPDTVETLAIFRAVYDAYVRKGMAVADGKHDPGSPEMIAEQYLGPNQDGTLGEFGGTDSEANAAAEADAQQAADTYAGSDRDGEFAGTSNNSTDGSSSSDSDEDRNGADSDSSSGGQSTSDQAAETYSDGDSAGEFG